MMATTTQVQAALDDVANLLYQADAMLAMGNINDDHVRDALEELLDELARVDPAQLPADTDIAPLVAKTDRVRDLLDQVSLEPA
jgi:hypothetical protein